MEKLRQRSLNIALVSTLIAIGLFVYLTKQHYALKFGGMTGSSVCNVSERFNCDAVAASEFSAFLGVPIALWGAALNAVLLVFLLITRLGWTDDPEKTARYTLWLSAVNLAGSFVMGSISLAFMHQFCLFCMACYIFSILTFGAAWKGAGGWGPQPMQDLLDVFTNQRWVLFMLAAVPAVAVLTHASAVEAYGFSKIGPIAREKVQQWQIAPEKKFDLAQGLVMQASGSPAKMTIVEFADFRCPHCKHAYPTLHAFANSHPDVKLIFKFFPLDGTCNPSPRMQGGDGISCLQAFIVQCEEKLSRRGWQAHHSLFDQQERYQTMSKTEDVLSAYCADNPGVDCNALRSCTESTETRDAVRAQAQEGLDADVMGTPAIYVNNKVLSGGQVMPILEEAYRSMK